MAVTTANPFREFYPFHGSMRFEIEKTPDKSPGVNKVSGNLDL